MKDKIKKLLIEALLPTTEDEINKVSVVINDNGFNRWFQPFASVCIIVNENNEVLLGKCLQEDHRLGKLCFVGGKIDKGENPYEAAERESFEEAGVLVKSRPMKIKFNNTNPDLAFIVCDYIEGELNPNDEFEFLNWYSFQELLDNDFENVLDENVELIKLLFKENLKEAADRPKIKLRAMWQDREERRLKELKKMLSQEVIDGDLILQNEPIENLGNIKHIKGNLNLAGCKNLKELPEGLIIDGGFVLRDCINLKTLPNNLKVNGKVFISNANLKLTDERLQISEEITLVKCKINFVNSMKKRYPLKTQDFHTIYK